MSIVVAFGYGRSQVTFIKRHEDQAMAILMVLPVALLFIGLIGSITMVWKHKKKKAQA